MTEKPSATSAEDVRAFTLRLANAPSWIEREEMIASALSDIRRKALEEAARAVCKRCGAGEPVRYAEEDGDPSAGMWWHRLNEGADIACVAMHVRRLLKTEGE